MKKNNPYFVVFVVVMTLLVGFGCALSLPGSSPSATETPKLNDQAPSQSATPGPVQKTLAVTALPAVPTLPLPENSIATLQPLATTVPGLSTIQTRLDTLNSYTLTFDMQFKGVDKDGKAVDQGLSILQELVKAKNAQHIKMSGLGLESLGGAIEIFELDKQSYMYMSVSAAQKPSCISFSSDQAATTQSALLNPSDIVRNITPDTLIASGEMVNGIKTDHFKVKNANLGIGITKSSSGEMWVSQEGAYLVKFTGTAEGTFDLMSKSVTGSTTWTYNLTTINQLADILLPADCAKPLGAQDDLPMPANATGVSSLGGIIVYNSPDAPSVVGDFYRAQLPDKGWKITSDSSLGTVVMLTIEKNDKKYSVMISPAQDNKGASVLITEAK